ncbi:unnamed protein product [Callosobruchus maculatus]|nr:unnamed protein product [Callosobruchus maculatus]
MVWTSPTIPHLKSNDTLINPLGDSPATVSDISLIAGIYFFGSVAGCLVPAKVLDNYGRKSILALMAALMSVASIVLAFAGSVWLYCICRLILGMGKGTTLMLVPIYTGEVAHKGNRGRFAFFMPTLLAMGLVYSYITGPHFSTRVYTLLCTVPILLALVLILLVVPETPYFLVAQNRPRHEVAEVLGKLRSSDDLVEELKQIEGAVVGKYTSGKSSYRSLFRDRASRKAFMISTAAITFHLLSGVSIIHSFLGPILDKVTAAFLSGNTSAIAISLVKLFSTATGSMAVERCGRKPLFIWSAIFVAMSHYTLGLYFQLQELEYDFVFLLAPLPFICFVLFALVYSFGMGPVPFAYLSEFFPQHTKNVGVPICTAIGALLNAFITLVFPYFMEYLGMQWVFWLFAVSCTCCAIFTKYVIPETKGKTLEEIQRMLEE